MRHEKNRKSIKEIGREGGRDEHTKEIDFVAGRGEGGRAVVKSGEVVGDI